MSPLLDSPGGREVIVKKADSRTSNKIHPVAWKMEGNEEKRILVHTKRSTSQVWPDCLLMILHYAQVYCVIQSMALRWPWPLKWLKSLHYVFCLNLDPWDFYKLQQNETYVAIAMYNIHSNELHIDYKYLLLVWGAFLCIALAVFVIVLMYIYISNRLSKETSFAYLRWAYIVILRVITLPLGIVCARVFHCNDDNRVDIMNELKCYEKEHWFYIVPSLFVILLFCVYIIWLFVKPRSQLLKMSVDRHEGYLQLKEAEYLYGLDPMWAVTNFFLFASYRKQGTYLKACLTVLDLLLILSYAFLFNYTTAQSGLVTSLLFFASLSLIIIRPFRIMVFNLMIIVSFMCLSIQSLLGALMVVSPSSSNRNIWLTSSYVTYELAILNGFWVFCIILLVLYLIIRTFRCCCKKGCNRYPLWPSLVNENRNGNLSQNTSKYVYAVLQGRILIG